MNTEIGNIVISKAGHDKGDLLIVLKAINDEYVLVVDGKCRTLERPKMKKLKHLKATGFKAEAIADAIQNNRQLLDAHIRDAIKQLCSSDGGKYVKR